MDVQRGGYSMDPIVKGLAGAMSAALAYRIGPSYKIITALGAATAVSCPFSKRTSRFFQVLLGSFLMGQGLVLSRLHLRGTWLALKVGRWREAERALLKSSFYLGVKGALGWSLVVSAIQKSHHRNPFGKRRVWDKLCWISDGRIRKVWQLVDYIGLDYGKMAASVLAQRWSSFTDEERDAAIDRVWNGSWGIPMDRFLEAFKGGEHEADLKRRLEARPRVDVTWAEENLKKVSFPGFEATIGKYEQIKQADEKACLEDITQWDQEIRPICVFDQLMKDPQMAMVNRQVLVDAYLGKDPISFIQQRTKWYEVTDGASLASRFAALIDPVLAGHKPVDKRRWEGLSPVYQPYRSSVQKAWDTLTTQFTDRDPLYAALGLNNNAPERAVIERLTLMKLTSEEAIAAIKTSSDLAERWQNNKPTLLEMREAAARLKTITFGAFVAGLVAIFMTERMKTYFKATATAAGGGVMAGTALRSHQAGKGSKAEDWAKRGVSLMDLGWLSNLAFLGVWTLVADLVRRLKRVGTAAASGGLSLMGSQLYQQNKEPSTKP